MEVINNIPKSKMTNLMYFIFMLMSVRCNITYVRQYGFYANTAEGGIIFTITNTLETLGNTLSCIRENTVNNSL